MKHYAVIVLTFVLLACSSEPEVVGDGDANLSETSQQTSDRPSLKATTSAIEVAPESTSFSVAQSYEIISEAEHDCSKVTKVEAKNDSTIATCDNGEKYRVVRITQPQVQEVAMKCSAMVKLGIADAC